MAAGSLLLSEWSSLWSRCLCNGQHTLAAYRLELSLWWMGKMDKRTRRGKIFKASSGKCRPQKDKTHKNYQWWHQPQLTDNVDSIKVPLHPPPAQRQLPEPKPAWMPRLTFAASPYFNTCRHIPLTSIS